MMKGVTELLRLSVKSCPPADNSVNEVFACLLLFFLSFPELCLIAIKLQTNYFDLEDRKANHMQEEKKGKNRKSSYQG